MQAIVPRPKQTVRRKKPSRHNKTALVVDEGKKEKRKEKILGEPGGRDKKKEAAVRIWIDGTSYLFAG